MPAADPAMAGARLIATGPSAGMVGDAGAFVGLAIPEDVDAPSWGD